MRVSRTESSRGGSGFRKDGLFRVRRAVGRGESGRAAARPVPLALTPGHAGPARQDTERDGGFRGGSRRWWATARHVPAARPVRSHQLRAQKDGRSPALQLATQNGGRGGPGKRACESPTQRKRAFPFAAAASCDPVVDGAPSWRLDCSSPLSELTSVGGREFWDGVSPPRGWRPGFGQLGTG